VADVSIFEVGESIRIGSGSNYEDNTIISVHASLLEAMLATSGTIELGSPLENNHVAGEVIEVTTPEVDNEATPGVRRRTLITTTTQNGGGNSGWTRTGLTSKDDIQADARRAASALVPMLLTTVSYIF
jgi:hypothetical protein